MASRNRAGFLGAVALLLTAILMNGCAGGGQTLGDAGGQTPSQEVTTEYLLTKAGFKRLAVNDETPKRQALLNSIPPGKLVTYSRNGQVYHAYAVLTPPVLYLGDAAAFQRYQALAKDRKLCEQVPGKNPVEFWSCMQEYQERGPGR